MYEKQILREALQDQLVKLRTSLKAHPDFSRDLRLVEDMLYDLDRGELCVA